jgi:flagellar biogenesis protein FliO
MTGQQIAKMTVGVVSIIALCLTACWLVGVIH